MSTPSQAAKAYIEAKEAAEAAEAALKAAKAELEVAYAAAGTDKAIVDGVKVTVTETSRSTYDADVLSGLVKPTILKKVTKLTVDATKLRAAIATELIAQDVADAATKTSTFTRVDIVAVSAESKSANRASSAA